MSSSKFLYGLLVIIVCVIGFGFGHLEKKQNTAIRELQEIIKLNKEEIMRRETKKTREVEESIKTGKVVYLYSDSRLYKVANILKKCGANYEITELFDIINDDGTPHKKTQGYDLFLQFEECNNTIMVKRRTLPKAQHRLINTIMEIPKKPQSVIIVSIGDESSKIDLAEMECIHRKIDELREQIDVMRTILTDKQCELSKLTGDFDVDYF